MQREEEGIFSVDVESTEFLDPNPIGSKPLVDHSKDFALPFRLDKVPRLNSAYENEGIPLGRRTLTERRGYTYPHVVFSRKAEVNHVNSQIIYHDLLLKGGGTRLKQTDTVFKRLKSSTENSFTYEPDNPLPIYIQESAGRKRLIRFSTEDLIGLTSQLGVHGSDRGESDNQMSQYLEHEVGLRTRSLVAMWEMPPETNMSTPSGIITAKEFEQKTGTKAGLEAWAMRCKYRVQDILRFDMEVINGDLEPGIVGFKNGFAQIDKPRREFDYGTYKLRRSDDPSNLSLTADQHQNIKEGYMYIANEVMQRAQYDEDTRFSDLGKKYKAGIGEQNLESFYSDYFKQFSFVLGEQFAKMQQAHAVSGMFNLQNITLLAEIVDHDVTMIDGKVKDSHGNLVAIEPQRLKHFAEETIDPTRRYYEQLKVGYDAMRKMICDTQRLGITHLNDAELKTFLSDYLISFRNYLSQHAPEELASIHSELLQNSDKNIKPESDAPDFLGEDSTAAFARDVLAVFS